MALKIVRYTTDYDESTADEVFWEDDEGEWVKYEDHEDMMVLATYRLVGADATQHDALRMERDRAMRAASQAESSLQEAQDAARRWETAWHEGDAIRQKLQDRIDELTGERRAADARARKAETELADARAKLVSVGWVRDAMTRACPGWQRQFAAHAGVRWDRGDTTADEQLAWVLNRLVDRIKAQDKKTGFEEG